MSLPTIGPPLPGVTYVFPTWPGWFDHVFNGHGYPATDIFAERGTAVVSVTAGVVAFMNDVDRWENPPDDPALRGGKYVAVRGDDGLQYYFSHLDVIRPGLGAGLRVEAGELLGYVGTTGSARHTPPHLHFGISCPTAPEDWEARRGTFDPLPYLAAWERGDGSASPATSYLAFCAAAP
jgi:murein DD-endopeptidase MepM/ murein hydrolase activator NlpD